MKLVFKIYLAVIASLFLFLIAVVLLGLVLGGYAQREFNEKVAKEFRQEIKPALLAEHQRYRFDEFLTDAQRNIPPHIAKEFGISIHKPFDDINKDFARQNHNEFRPRRVRPKRPRLYREKRRLLRDFTRTHFAQIVFYQNDNAVLPVGRPIAYRYQKKWLGRLAYRYRSTDVVITPTVYARITTYNPNVSISSFGSRFAIGLGVLFICVGLIAFPISRRITKRLDTLSKALDNWGVNEQDLKSHLSALVSDAMDNESSMANASKESKASMTSDEISQLTHSFIQASDRIDTLVKANKLLLANASHEIRTPLTRIRLNMQMIEDLFAQNADLQSTDQPIFAQSNVTKPNLTKQSTTKQSFEKRTQAIKKNLTELDMLVESILQNSRLDAQTQLENPKPIDLYQLAMVECQHFNVDLLSDYVSNNVTNNVSNHISNSANDFMLMGQENLLIQMLRNLLENAHKYGKPPVSVHIKHIEKYIQNQNHSKNNSNKNSNSLIELTIRDHGEGIPADKLDDIFKPFVRLNAHKNNTRIKGNGLGLNLVQKIVVLHQGNIYVKNHDVGTSFVVELPCVKK